MIALALIPSASIVGLALASGELRIAAEAGTRWLIEVVLVLAFSLLVFGWKQSRTHRRRMLL